MYVLLRLSGTKATSGDIPVVNLVDEVWKRFILSLLQMLCPVHCVYYVIKEINTAIKIPYVLSSLEYNNG